MIPLYSIFLSAFFFFYLCFLLFVVCFWRYDWCFDEDQHHKRTNLVIGIKFLFVSDDITGRTSNKTDEINPNACLLKSTTQLVFQQKDKLNKYCMNTTANRRKTHHGMRSGFASMTSSAKEQINIRDSTILMWYGYSFKKGRLVIQNNNS